MRVFFYERYQFMTTIKIDNVEYKVDKLSNETKAQLVSLQFCDQELQRLQAQAAVRSATPAWAYADQDDPALQPFVTRHIAGCRQYGNACGGPFVCTHRL
jgi:hypothetical protein